MTNMIAKAIEAQWERDIAALTTGEQMGDKKQWLRDQPVGTVVQAARNGSYWRKGRNDTWHPINTSGYRLGRDNTIRSAYLTDLIGPVSVSAETERIQTLHNH